MANTPKREVKIMTINIQKASNLKAQGVRTNGNCKPVFCITTGEVYASSIDAAKAIGVQPSTLSWAISRGSKCQGKKFCFIANVIAHLDEIAECNRIRENKVMAYDAINARKEAMRKATEDYEKRKANCELLRQKLEKELALMTEAEKHLNTLKEEETK